MFVGTAWSESTFFYSDSSRCGWTTLSQAQGLYKQKMPIYKIGPRYLYLVIKICVKPKSFNIVFVSNIYEKT